MKKTLLLILILSLTSSLYTQNLNDSLKRYFNEGNQFYQAGNYQKAIESYTYIINKNFKSAYLYYNLGNAYHKINEPAKAILWFERALKLDPSNDDIKHNIAFVNQQLEDKIEIIPKFFISEWYLNIVYSLTTDQWAVMSIFACFLMIFSLISSLFTRNVMIKTTTSIFVFLFLFITIFSIHFAYKINTRNEKNPEAIVMKSILTGKSTPDETGNDLFVIHKGIKVIITDQLNNWTEIKLPNGEKGWVQYTDIEKI